MCIAVKFIIVNIVMFEIIYRFIFKTSVCYKIESKKRTEKEIYLFFYYSIWACCRQRIKLQANDKSPPRVVVGIVISVCDIRSLFYYSWDLSNLQPKRDGSIGDRAETVAINLCGQVYKSRWVHGNGSGESPDQSRYRASSNRKQPHIRPRPFAKENTDFMDFFLFYCFFFLP